MEVERGKQNHDLAEAYALDHLAHISAEHFHTDGARQSQKYGVSPQRSSEDESDEEQCSRRFLRKPTGNRGRSTFTKDETLASNLATSWGHTKYDEHSRSCDAVRQSKRLAEYFEATLDQISVMQSELSSVAPFIRLRQRHSCCDGNCRSVDQPSMEMLKDEIMRINCTLNSITGLQSCVAAVEDPLVELSQINSTLKQLVLLLSQPHSIETISHATRTCFENVWSQSRKAAQEEMHSSLSAWRCQALCLKEKLNMALDTVQLSSKQSDLRRDAIKSALEFVSTIYLCEVPNEHSDERKNRCLSDAAHVLRGQLLELQLAGLFKLNSTTNIRCDDAAVANITPFSRSIKSVERKNVTNKRESKDQRATYITPKRKYSDAIGSKDDGISKRSDSRTGPSTFTAKDQNHVATSTQNGNQGHSTPVGCFMCHQDNSQDALLLCDNDCGREFHTFCLSPAIAKIPEGDWYCPICLKDEKLEGLSDVFKCSASYCNKITGAKYCKVHRCGQEDCLNRIKAGGYCRRHESMRSKPKKLSDENKLSTDLLISNDGKKEIREKPRIHIKPKPILIHATTDSVTGI